MKTSMVLLGVLGLCLCGGGSRETVTGGYPQCTGSDYNYVYCKLLSGEESWFWCGGYYQVTLAPPPVLKDTPGKAQILCTNNGCTNVTDFAWDYGVEACVTEVIADPITIGD